MELKGKCHHMGQWYDAVIDGAILNADAGLVVHKVGFDHSFVHPRQRISVAYQLIHSVLL